MLRQKPRERPLVLQPPGTTRQRRLQQDLSGLVHSLRSWEANSWTELSLSGALPGRRFAHVALWSDGADGFFIFGGSGGAGIGGLNDVWFYSRQESNA